MKDMHYKKPSLQNFNNKMGDDNDNDDDIEVRKMVIVEEKYCYKEEIELTVHKKSMFSLGDGFLVYDPNGDIIFRADFYGLMKHHGLLLMDTLGKPLLTLLPKRPTLHHRLEGFLGETADGQEPVFSIFKSTIIGGSRVMVEVYQYGSTIEYHIDGSFKERSCTIVRVQPDMSTEHVAEIKRKVETTRQMMLSTDVFRLILQPGVDAAFAMGLVLALDTIDGDDVALSTSVIA